MNEEQTLSSLLECIASGLEVSETREAVSGGKNIPLGILLTARTEAFAQGVESEDIATSWKTLEEDSWNELHADYNDIP